MLISVIICTRNRASSLKGTLESLLTPENLALPDWELVLVDNASTDNTGELAASFAAQYPEKIVHAQERRPGLSLARNTGVALARGEILAWTDDDVLISPGYLPAVRETFSDPSIDAAQGRISLDCAGGLPSWLGRECVAMLSLREYGTEPLEWRENLSGCNMVMRASLFARFGGFSPLLGAGAVGYMEDSEFSLRLRKAGCRMVYAPGIYVRHQIQRQRLSPQFFRRCFFNMGRSAAYLEPLNVPLWRFSLYAARTAFGKEAYALWQLARGRRTESLRLQCQARQQLGFARQHRLFRRGSSQPLWKPGPAPGNALPEVK
jgi:glycosyltransferase involved in cell wall biosynthesis